MIGTQGQGKGRAKGKGKGGWPGHLQCHVLAAQGAVGTQLHLMVGGNFLLR